MQAMKNKIPFNSPLCTKNQSNNLLKVAKNGHYSGDGPFTKQCHEWLEIYFKKKCLLTTSCTHALEMAALICEIGKGDEVIMPSYTFVSSANAFVLRGAKIVFIDINPETMNMDETLVEKAITKKTKAIVAVHYAGISCDMDKLMKIKKKHKLLLIEDAAQAIGSTYKNRKLGTFGDFGCLSFHETKNIHCGEGGALIVNNKRFFELAEVIREKGTNRSQFYRGKVDKYRWISVGSSYLPSEFNAAYLLPQLLKLDVITKKRKKLWSRYYQNLSNNKDLGLISIPGNISHNGHMFYIKLESLKQRNDLITFLSCVGVHATFHYIPLHESRRCKIYNRFHGTDNHTTKESQKLLRLPMYYDLTLDDVDFICRKINEFLSNTSDPCISPV